MKLLSLIFISSFLNSLETVYIPGFSRGVKSVELCNLRLSRSFFIFNSYFNISLLEAWDLRKFCVFFRSNPGTELVGFFRVLIARIFLNSCVFYFLTFLSFTFSAYMFGWECRNSLIWRVSWSLSWTAPGVWYRIWFCPFCEIFVCGWVLR